MQTDLQITFRDFPHSDKLEARVREHVTKLDELFNKITTCRVALEAPHRSHNQGKKYRCRIDLVVPNAEIVCDHDDEVAFTAIDDAFGQAIRSLEDYARKARWDVKQHDSTPHARVAKLMKEEAPGARYGFLETHDGREIYFHENSVLNHNFGKLEVGTEVRFAEEEGDKGPQASTVAITKRRSTVTTTTANADQIPESRT